MFEARAISCSLLVLLAVSYARAATVALVEPNCSTQDAMEALSRLHGELLSVGLEIARTAPPADHDLALGGYREWVYNRRRPAVSTRSSISAAIRNL
ncbi:MAG: hypothetical protein QM784_01415 [Polyangiaceae bacterium]